MGRTLTKYITEVLLVHSAGCSILPRIPAVNFLCFAHDQGFFTCFDPCPPVGSSQGGEEDRMATSRQFVNSFEDVGAPYECF